ncbi:TPA: hypothetical protein ACH3X2_002511 [Trebouxia sp. C0005]
MKLNCKATLSSKGCPESEAGLLKTIVDSQLPSYLMLRLRTGIQPLLRGVWGLTAGQSDHRAGQADKLVFIASQAAVDKRGSQEDMHEQDVAALCEAEVCQELACTGQQLQESAEESAEEEDDKEEEEQHCEEPNREEWEPHVADLKMGGLHDDIRQLQECKDCNFHRVFDACDYWNI